MSAATDQQRADAGVPAQAGPAGPEWVLPELKPSWETGIRARAQAGLVGVFTGLPGTGVPRSRGGVARRPGAHRHGGHRQTLVAGVMAAFGLLATQRVLIELFEGGPTGDRVRAAFPALLFLAAATAARGAVGMAVGYALNGLTPRVTQLVEPELFEHTTAVDLAAWWCSPGVAQGSARPTGWALIGAFTGRWLPASSSLR